MSDRELLPLIIAVVGHRDLRPEDVPVLETSVDTVLRELQATAPSTPLMVLSALAEGADRLVARVAVRRGIKLIVPMPKVRAVYESEFADDASRAEFDALVDSSDEWFELAPDALINEPPSDLHYEHLIAYLAKHSQILLALWDGVDSNLTGGTGNAVRFKLHGVPSRLDPRRTPLDPPDTGPVLHIITPRLSNPASAGNAGGVVRLLPPYAQGSTGGETYNRVVRHMNNFNFDTQETLAAIQQKEEIKSSPLLHESDLKTFTDPMRQEARAFEEADTLAQFFQHKTNRVVGLFMVLAFFALFCFEIYAYYLYDQPWILLLYILPVAAAYGMYLVAHRRDYQNKYLDYRALAEGLRVQWFWHLAGVNASVADHYLRKQRTELDWIRHAIRIWQVRVVPSVPEPEEPPLDATHRNMQLVMADWVQDQAVYYSRAAQRDDARARRLRSWSNKLFFAGMSIALLHVLIQWLGGTKEIPPLLMVMSMLLIIAGLLVVFIDKRGFVGQAKQFARMAELFSSAKHRLDTALQRNDIDAMRSLIFELGKETLAENADWVLMHRERPLEVPKLG